MREYIEQRVREVAEYIIEKRTTVRGAAAKFGVSKSTVHNDMSVRLRELDSLSYKEVSKVLNYNFSVRHLIGGESTRRKFKK